MPSRAWLGFWRAQCVRPAVQGLAHAGHLSEWFGSASRKIWFTPRAPRCSDHPTSAGRSARPSVPASYSAVAPGIGAAKSHLRCHQDPRCPGPVHGAIRQVDRHGTLAEGSKAGFCGIRTLLNCLFQQRDTAATAPGARPIEIQIGDTTTGLPACRQVAICCRKESGTRQLKMCTRSTSSTSGRSLFWSDTWWPRCTSRLAVSRI